MRSRYIAVVLVLHTFVQNGAALEYSDFSFIYGSIPFRTGTVDPSDIVNAAFCLCLTIS